jgi:VanZ family protein
MRGYNRSLALVLALAAATLLFFHFYPRYQPVGPPLFAGTDFAPGLAGWQVSGDAGIEVVQGRLRLTAQGSDRHVYIRQQIAAPPSGTLLGINALLKVHDVRPGPKPWHKARIVIEQSAQADGSGIFLSAEVFSLVGTSDWVPVEVVMPVAPGARGLRLYLELTHASGRADFRALTIHPVAESPAARAIYWVLIGAWGLVFLSMFWRLWSMSRGGSRWLLAGFAATLLAGILLPGKLKYALGDIVLRWLLAHLDRLGEFVGSVEATHLASTFAFYSPKIGHFLFFMLAAVFLARALHRLLGPFRILFSLIVLGAVTELLQRFVPGRTATLTDVGIDAAGAACGLSLACLMRSRHQRV